MALTGVCRCRRVIMPLRRASACLMLLLLVAQTRPIESPPLGVVDAVVVLCDGTPVIATDRAIYLADKADFTKWTSLEALPTERRFISIAGGTKDRVFFVARERTPDKAGNSYSLWAWSNGKPISEVCRMPDSYCVFYDDTRGVHFPDRDIIDLHGSIVLTLDGGRTWKTHKRVLPERERAVCALWLSKEKFLLGSTLTLMLCEVSDAGTLKVLWSREGGGLALFRYDAKAFFASTQTAEVRGSLVLQLSDIKTGQVRAHLPGAAGSAATIGDTVLLSSLHAIYYDGPAWLKAWRYQDGEIKELGQTDDQLEDLVRVGNDVYGVTPDRRTVARIAPTPLKISPVQIAADNSAALATIAARDAAREQEDLKRGLPTTEEVKEMVRLAAQIPIEVQVKVERRLREDKKMTRREKCLMRIEEYKRILKEREKVTPAPSTRP